MKRGESAMVFSFLSPRSWCAKRSWRVFSRRAPRIWRRRKFRRFAKSGSGIGSIEFALMLPMLLALYAGFVSVTTATRVSGQVAQVASTVSDLIAQSRSITPQEVDDVLKAGEAIAGTGGARDMMIEAIGIRVDEDGQALVVWSRDKNGAEPAAPGSIYTLPDSLMDEAGFIVASKARLNFTPTILPDYLSFVSIPFRYEYYFVPRSSLISDCSGC